MTNPVVTDEMVQAAWKVYAASPVENGWKSAMRYALIAALEASSDNPTPEAYEAACKALWKHREENERLQAALQKLYDGLAWDWRGRPVGDLPTLREIARTALEGCTV
jgi:hypothetical protein